MSPIVADTLVVQSFKNVISKRLRNVSGKLGYQIKTGFAVFDKTRLEFGNVVWFVLDIANIHKVASDACSSSHGRRHQMGAAFEALTAFKITV